MSTGFITHNDYLRHETGMGHPERPQRLRAICTEIGQHEALRHAVGDAPPYADANAFAADLDIIHRSLVSHDAALLEGALALRNPTEATRPMAAAEPLELRSELGPVTVANVNFAAVNCGP